MEEKNLIEQIGGRPVFIQGNLPPGQYERTNAGGPEPDGYIRKTAVSLIFRPFSYTAGLRFKIFAAIFLIFLAVVFLNIFWKLGIIRL